MSPGVQAELQLREVSAGELPAVEGRQRRGWEVPQDPVLLGELRGSVVCCVCCQEPR